MMKFNWGHGIFLFFSLFVSVSLYQLYASRKYMPDLVNENYYLDDIHLNEYITKKKNVVNLSNFHFGLNISRDSIAINIPHQNDISIGILYQSPVSKKEDISQNIFLQRSNNKLILPLTKLRKGNWNIELKWKDGEKPFLFESKIIKE